ncbi:MAG: radical SAM protein [Clostridia bacterium]|nr:radical SAM protein [Clostridia bacterium]
MKNVYMVQASTTYGGNIFKSAYLPYASGLLVAYAWSDPAIKAAYDFKRFVFTKENVREAAASFEDPAIVGFSNYIWNTEYNKALAAEVKRLFPSCAVIFGGHNVPPGGEFLEKFGFIDYLIHAEGEEAFRALLLALNEPEPELSGIENISYRDADGTVRTTETKVLTGTDYPSPYLTGVFDDIIEQNPDMQLDAILETSRGCPRNCAYCDWGCTNSLVKLFPLERVLAEIEWFGTHKIAFLWGADANFGQYDRDELITDKLIETHEKYGYPERIRTNYAKNRYEQVFRISRKLETVGLSKEGATLSFQSLNPATLKCIGRANMSFDKFRELMQMYRENGVTTYSELILGLPEETYESFCRGIGKLLELGQHRLINVYNCEILPNSPMAQKSYLEKYGIRTANVDFLIAHSSANPEIREKTNYVVGTSAMSPEEWVRANIFACFEKTFHHYGLMVFIAVYLFYEMDIPYERFYNDLIALSGSSDDHLLNNAYSFLTRFYTDVIDEKPISLYTNDLYGKITWDPEHTPFMDIIYRADDYYRAVSPLIRSYGVDEDVLDELIRYQTTMLKRPGRNHFSERFTYDWHGYFELAMRCERVPPAKRATVVSVDNDNTLGSWVDFAIEAAWFGKNGSSFNPGVRSVPADGGDKNE